MAKSSIEREETVQGNQVLLLAETYEERINQFSKAPNEGSI